MTHVPSHIVVKKVGEEAAKGVAQEAAREPGIVTKTFTFVQTPAGLIILIAALGYFFYKEFVKEKEEKQFEGRTLKTIFNENVDELLNFLGKKCKFHLWINGMRLGTIDKYAVIKTTPNKYAEEITEDTKAALKRGGRKKEAENMEVPRLYQETFYLLKVRKPGLFNYIFSLFNFNYQKLVVSENLVKRNGIDLQLIDKVELNMYAGVWIVSRKEEELLHSFAWRYLAETVIEQQANLGKAMSYFNQLHAMHIDKEKQEAEIESSKYRDNKERKWFKK